MVEQAVYVKHLEVVSNIKGAIKEILNGNTVLYIEGSDSMYTLSTSKVEHRSVDRPQNEQVLKGPNEGFVESGQLNRALIRKQLRNEYLVSESISVGE